MAHYLPVLLVSVNAFYPDDSAVTQRPRNQVDYLSHQWEEEDVWRSWRNMTRQKNEIANGVRLENASWRTWWKQRNKLKTISPETLNWLKDSDVTWLYGPLHTATDGAPPPKTSSDEVGRTTPLEDDEEPCAYEPKPILKHRSISQMLTSDLPSPLYSPPESEEENDHYGGGGGDTNAREMPAPGRSIPTRPPLLHTKSDTHVIRWGPNKRAFRRDSPPRIHASGYSVASSSSATHSRVPRSGSSTNVSAYFAGSDPEHSSSNVVHPAPGKRKHISFNTFVEQCIAIDKPKSPPNDWSPKSKGEYDDGCVSFLL
ncbi:hypothetical protein BDV98DRAFT_612336 [Pterulicium gracile]|uniref:Nitrogen regulatory protein areA GATA-like domain-containing protein n=1 Tax=Pterulicium gracile TaxID=1884261 RepID=A0A5C3QLR9_9AGAR|nr:hypothetical protein BDV98DRAFT_612336 [Pterula gracilis]